VLKEDAPGKFTLSIKLIDLGSVKVIDEADTGMIFGISNLRHAIRGLVSSDDGGQ
jgi:hypothetical protein